jgi:agmatinase
MTEQNRSAQKEPQQASYAGLVTFMRQPAASSADGADLAVLGVPFDVATTNRPGARFGPRAIREQSLQLAWGPIWPWNFDPFARLATVDLGDVHFDWGRPQDMPAAVTAAVSGILAAGARPLVFGGDHYVTLPVLRAMAAHHGPVALIHFDAHRDVEEGTGCARLDHGIVFSEALREGLLREEACVQVGIRTTYPGETGERMTVIDAAAVHATTPEETAARIRSIVGDHPVYLSFDIDCLDPAFAPGTGTPVPGGLSTHQARAILWGLKELRFIGFDVMEVAPGWDPAGITALAAAMLAVDFCALACHAPTPARP